MSSSELNIELWGVSIELTVSWTLNSRGCWMSWFWIHWAHDKLNVVLQRMLDELTVAEYCTLEGVWWAHQSWILNSGWHPMSSGIEYSNAAMSSPYLVIASNAYISTCFWTRFSAQIQPWQLFYDQANHIWSLLQAHMFLYVSGTIFYTNSTMISVSWLS